MFIYADTTYIYEGIKRVLGIDFPDLSSTKNFCSNCTKEAKRPHALKTCSRCRSVEYCCENCHRAHWKKHKRYCVAPEESAALIAAEYMNFSDFDDDERERVVEATEKAFTICRHNRVRTLTMLRVLCNYFLLVARLHLTVPDLVRVFGVPASSAAVVTEIVTLLDQKQAMTGVLARKVHQIAALRDFRDKKCALLRNAMNQSKFYSQNEELAKLERVSWKYVCIAADEFCRATLVQWLELVTEYSNVASDVMDLFFTETISVQDVDCSPFGSPMPWTDYVSYLWWELAWIVENTSETTIDGIVPSEFRDAILIKDFNDGEDEATTDDPDYQREELPALDELRTNFYEYFKNEARTFRYNCVATQCWEGPYTWIPAHICNTDNDAENTSEQVLVLGKRYKAIPPGHEGRTQLIYVASDNSSDV